MSELGGYQGVGAPSSKVLQVFQELLVAGLRGPSGAGLSAGSVKDQYRLWDPEMRKFVYDFHILPGGEAVYKGKLLPRSAYDQCTGILDCKGNMIFHGDIVSDREGVNGVVEWDEHQARFELHITSKVSQTRSSVGVSSDDDTGLEIIGHVHQFTWTVPEPLLYKPVPPEAALRSRSSGDSAFRAAFKVVECTSCKGTGSIIVRITAHKSITKPCNRCSGSGRVLELPMTRSNLRMVLDPAAHKNN